MIRSGRHFVSNDGGWLRKYLVSKALVIQGAKGRPQFVYPTVSRHFTFAGATKRCRRENAKRGFTA